MNRDEADKRAEEYANTRGSKECNDDSWIESFMGYLQSYDDLQSKLREVPWTDEEWIAFSKKQVDQRDNAVVARFEMIQWAEQKIKERG